MAKIEDSLSEKITNQATAWLTKVIKILALTLTRIIIIVIFLIIVGILSYTHVLKPLNQETTLPPGVTRVNPELSIDLLQRINAQRVERSNSSPHQFAVSNLFLASAPVNIPQ